jgi:hypothetical protein
MQMDCLQANKLSCALKSSTFDAQAAALTSRAQYGAGATLGVAQAVGGGFGVQGAVGFEVDYASGGAAGLSFGSVPAAFHVGAAPSFDLGRWVPLTLMAEYLFTVTVEKTVTSSANAAGAVADDNTLLTLRNAVAGGVYYTGRPDLQIGALFGATFDHVTTTGSDGSTSAQPSLTRLAGQVTGRYFF